MIVKRYINGKPVITTEVDAPSYPPPSINNPEEKKSPVRTKSLPSSAPGSPAPAKKAGGCGCGRK